MEIKKLTRGAGVLMAISSLPSAYGIGTLGNAACNFVDMLVDLKQRYWQILPIGPTSFGNSPYQPISAFAGNDYLIDLDDLVNKKLLTNEEIRSFDWGKNQSDIDYASMYNNRTKVLKLAFERFDTKNEDYRLFVKRNDYWLDDYALFRVLKDRHDGREWLSWEEKYRNREADALQEARKQFEKELDFYYFCQYEFECQFKQLMEYANMRGIRIIGEMPLYVAHDSADVWAHRDLFLLNEEGKAKLVSAVPPDAFSATGQIWGSPVYDWDAMDNDKYTWWRARASKAASFCNVLRLDHFIAIVKYYAVNPRTKTSTNGKWHKGPGRKFLDVINMSVGDTDIIIDDAGPKIVVPGVKKLVEKSGIPGCRILVFGLSGDSDNENLVHNFSGSNVILYTTTHDTETVTGFVSSRTDEAIEYLKDYTGVNEKEKLPDAIIKTAYGSVADVVIVPMQDLMGLGNEARMNAPSTVGGNWQWRINQNTLLPNRCDYIRKLAYLYRR